MFSRLGIRNFKAWKGFHTIDLKPLTLLLGVNSAGKTSLLQPLLLLRQTVDSPDRRQALNLGGQPRDILDLGTMYDVFSGNNPNLLLTFELDVRPTVVTEDDVKRADDWADRLGELAKQVLIKFHIDYRASPAGSLFVHKMSYTCGMLKVEAVRQKDRAYALSANGYLSDNASSATSPSFKPERSVAFSAEAVAALGNEGPRVQDLTLILTQELQSIAYLGPLREYPTRSYTWNSQMPGELGIKGERAVQALIASANMQSEGDDWLGRGSLVEHVSTWLKKMEVADGLELERQGKSNLYEVIVVRGSQRANLVDVGFGISQILPVITLAYFVLQGSTVILEQPEIHLHPLAQTSLADLFVEVSQKRGVQFLIETHSEHLFRRLQSLIADKTTTPDQCGLYFVDREKDDSAVLKTLDVDDFGRVKNWPPRFFGDAVGEAERQMRQMLLRKQRERSSG
jgi:predicted ATPase